MRDMVHIVGLFALVIVLGIGIIWSVDILLDIHYMDAHGAVASTPMVVLHQLPYFLLGGGLVLLYHRIFRR